MTTLAGYKDMVKALGFAQVTDDGAIVTAINMARQHVFAQRRWRFGILSPVGTVSTTAGSASVSLLALDYDALDVLDVRSDEWHAKRVPDSRIRDLAMLYPDETGMPEYWATGAILPDNTLRLWPTPDAVYPLTVTYVPSWPDLASDASVCQIPSKYANSVMWGATALLAVRQRDVNTANYAFRERDAEIVRMASDPGAVIREAGEIDHDDVWWQDAAL